MSFIRPLVVLSILFANAPASGAVGKQEALEVAARLMRAVAAREYAAATEMLAPSIRPLLPASRLEETMRQLSEQLGEYAELDSPAEAELIEGTWHVFKGVKVGETPLVSLVAVDDDGQVVGYRMMPLQAAAQLRARAAGEPEGATEQAPAPFPEVELSIGAGGGALGATLTLPEGEGPFPGAVLVHGSGPNDRDETLGPNKPFRDLAWGLAERGIAVLRYDKRTRAHSLGMHAVQGELTVDLETVSDAVAAIELLRARPEVDAERVVLVGHSLGAYLAPRIAARSPELAGAVLLAAPARPLGELLVEQTRYIFGLDGSLSEKEREQLAMVEAQAERIMDPGLTKDAPAAELPLGAGAAYWIHLQGYDPIALARQLTLPLLILQGDRDYQVTVAEDFRRWREGLEGRRAPTRFESYPSLNHLFIAGEGASTPSEYQVEGRVSDELMDDIRAWVRRLPRR